MGGCTQYQYANYSANYIYWGKGSIRLQLINQRSDFSFALFTGGLHNVRDDDRPLLIQLTGNQFRAVSSLRVSSLHPSIDP